MARSELKKKMNKCIRNHWQIDAIYLYGSRGAGRARRDSDWDLAILFTDYLGDPVDRALRPQNVEALLQRETKLYDLVSVVDLENVPPPLQWNIICGQKWFDRGVPHVRRVENSICSKIEIDYEQT
ncbi:MAG: nucleotidyltransferase domain-containing protein [Gammaproteobacteria bacterium]|nr:nucleotidyltransferase domain-containing protein [Gammaproteobacteria bacterium]